MQVHVNTDKNIQGEDLADRVRGMVSDTLARYGERVTRVDVHLSDENSTKAGADDKRCLLEARLAGMRPIAVSHQAEALLLAIDGALEKLTRALDSDIGRREEKR